MLHVKQIGYSVLCAVCGVLVGGCRTATRVTEVPRVDLSLQEGNRGYLVGTPPPASPLKTTRQIVEVDVEIPSFYKPKRMGGKVSLNDVFAAQAEPEYPLTEETAQAAVAGSFDTYVVQKGDSLWSIAAKPQIYGQASGWSRLFEANRDILKSPDHLREGMKLRIPRGEDGNRTAAGADEGTVFRK